MIASLTGIVQDKTEKSVILVASGVGYEVFVTRLFLESVKTGSELTLYTHHQVREDAQELYGFASQSELAFFKMLISVSGIGPKSGLAILSVSSIGDIQRAVADDDPSLLTKVSGIGTKTAERIVVELKSKIGTIEHPGTSTSSADSDVIDALVSLGYSTREAREAMRHVDRSVGTSSQRVHAALKVLGKKK